MPSLLFCGPKMAACGIVISLWGVIMLAMLGIFFTSKSAVLIEDVPFTEDDIRNDQTSNVNHDRLRDDHVSGAGLTRSCKHRLLLLRSKNPPQNVYALYNQVGINCFIAAAIYVAVGAVSLCQVRLNKRQEYMVT
ncbi:hypothetical protein F2P81_024861 [Scophthalmus maximus]|uniref:Uncharacterized protein n=1 Tax=Scophthalmus maximus TaxID=52904 RepID=A0A6A4RU25_SCOMX|nr:hypothetical protein F2P81_024861 [Scophthalmus maximus]